MVSGAIQKSKFCVQIAAEIYSFSLKLFILALIIIFVFSSFVFVDFPPGIILKTIVSVIQLGRQNNWRVSF